MNVKTPESLAALRLFNIRQHQIKLRINGFFGLVRMRSAVRICPAAPKNPQNREVLGIFCTVFAVKAVGQGVGHTADPHPDPQAETSEQAGKGNGERGGESDPHSERLFPRNHLFFAKRDFFFGTCAANGELKKLVVALQSGRALDRSMASDCS